MEEEKNITHLVVWGVVSWSTAFFILRKSLPKLSFDACNRMVSTAHAVLAVSLASASVQDWSSPISPLASNPSPLQVRALAVTLAYLIYDLICTFFDKRVNVDNAVHHLISIVGIGAALYYQKSGSELVAALWITEISSPFLHLRELLKEFGIRDTDLNLTVDIAFALIFSVGRIGFGPYLAYMTLSSNNPLIVKVMAVGLQLVSAFWFYKIARMVKYKIIKRAAPTPTPTPTKKAA